ncbi:farnesol dehydrogenase-like isoform X2 [Augochlora pura]
MCTMAGKVALVTVSGSVIGSAIANSLVERGIQVVGLARRLDKLQALTEKLGKNKFYPVQCDFAVRSDITRAFKWTDEKLGGADILVNNAENSPIEDHKKAFTAPMIYVREFTDAIRKRDASGHIINVTSVVPHGICGVTKSGQDIVKYGLDICLAIMTNDVDIRVTTVDSTFELSNKMQNIGYSGDEMTDKMTMLRAEDIAEKVIRALEAPLDE